MQSSDHVVGFLQHFHMCWLHFATLVFIQLKLVVMIGFVMSNYRVDADDVTALHWPVDLLVFSFLMHDMATSQSNACIVTVQIMLAAAIN